MTGLDLFGYVGSVLVAVSLMMSNLKRLRWINLLGAGIFSSYGFLLEAWPVFLLNGWIFLVDIYFLVRIYRFQDDFDMVELSSVRTPLFELLMHRYGDDIRHFFPDATLDNLDKAVALLVFRNMKPVGLFAYQCMDDHSQASPEGQQATVLIDYVIPEARDFKTAKFLFDRHSSELKHKNIQSLRVVNPLPAHKHYLLKVGFSEQNQELLFDFAKDRAT